MTSPESSPSGYRPWPTRTLRASIYVLIAALLALSAVSWIATARKSMGSMVPSLVFHSEGGGEIDSMSGTMGAPLFIGMWVVMMVAMMFPSVSPMVVSFWRISNTRNQGPLGLPVFVGGYLLIWSAIGVAAYAAYRGALWVAPSISVQQAAIAGGAVLALAGGYQLSRYKTVCLKHCRGPLEFLLHFKPGIKGAAAMGTEHGLYCLGCCWGLMLVLFALGLMNLAWMGAVAVVIFIEKVAPFGYKMAKGVGLGLIVLGALVAMWPAL